MEKSTFGQRMGDIMQEKDISRGALKDMTGISLQSISNYLNDKRKPDCEMVAEIAKALNVSADYLLGLQSLPSKIDADIHDETGLTSAAIGKLQKMNRDKQIYGHDGYIGLLEALILHGLYAGRAYSDYQKAKADYENKKECYRQMKPKCDAVEVSEKEYYDTLQSKLRDAEFKVLLEVSKAIQQVEV